MKLHLQIMLNECFFIRDPELSVLGKKIIKSSVDLIHSIGFEAFTFKKLANEIGTTEAGVYRYFENKQKLLMYLIAWYWRWLEYQIRIKILPINHSREKLVQLIELLETEILDDLNTEHINEEWIHKIVSAEGIRMYLQPLMKEQNYDAFTKPYKDVCKRIEEIILEFKPKYPYSKSLSISLLETAHHRHYLHQFFPTTLEQSARSKNKGASFLHHMVFASLLNAPKEFA